MREPVQLELFKEIEKLGYKIVEVSNNVWNIIHTITEDCYQAFGLNEVVDFFKFINLIPLSII